MKLTKLGTVEANKYSRAVQTPALTKAQSAEFGQFCNVQIDICEFLVVVVHYVPSTDDASPVRTSQPGDESPAG